MYFLWLYSADMNKPFSRERCVDRYLECKTRPSQKNQVLTKPNKEQNRRIFITLKGRLAGYNVPLSENDTVFSPSHPSQANQSKSKVPIFILNK